METRESLNMPHEAADPLRIAIVGTRFMGRSHSNAYSQVGHFFDLPAEPVRQVSHWLGAVARGQHAEPSFYDGLRSQQVLDAVLHASRKGTWQAIPES